MAQIRKILKRVEVEVAQGTRRCRRDQRHTITPGQPYLVIIEEGRPLRRSYCRQCALPILKRCAADLRTIRDALYGGPIPASAPAIVLSAGKGPQLVETSAGPVTVRVFDSAFAVGADGMETLDSPGPGASARLRAVK